MSQWKKVKIGDFLVQYRITIHVQDDKDYKQVTISSKDGVKFRCIKNGKDIGRKRQFLIDLKKYPKTVVFTRQGLHEGSIGIAPDNVDGCIATENMPMFAVNEDIIHSKYLQYLLKSQIFSDLVATLTPTGSAQKAIHERDLLPLKILIPDLPEQERIASEISQKLEKIEQLSSEIEKQKSYAKQLRANILQDAIEGKLTADWREKHSVKKGDPNYDAEALFEKIQIERISSKKEKMQEPSFFEELALPLSWKYPSLNEITKQITDGTHLTPNYVPEGEVFLSAQNVKPFKFIPEIHRFVSKKDFDLYRNNRNPEKDDVLMARVGAGIGEAAVIDTDLQFAFYVSLCLIKTFPNLVHSQYLCMVLNSLYGTNYAKNNISSSGSSAGNYNLGHIRSLKIPLPPLAEQKEIIARVEKHLEAITQLETQIATRETLTKQLMQGLLKDAFEEI